MKLDQYYRSQSTCRKSTRQPRRELSKKIGVSGGAKSLRIHNLPSGIYGRLTWRWVVIVSEFNFNDLFHLDQMEWEILVPGCSDSRGCSKELGFHFLRSFLSSGTKPTELQYIDLNPTPQKSGGWEPATRNPPYIDIQSKLKVRIRVQVKVQTNVDSVQYIFCFNCSNSHATSRLRLQLKDSLLKNQARGTPARSPWTLLGLTVGS